MATVTIQVPDDAFKALRRSPQELGREIRLAAAMLWYSQRGNPVSKEEIRCQSNFSHGEKIRCQSIFSHGEKIPCQSIFSHGGRPRRRDSRMMPRRRAMTSTHSNDAPTQISPADTDFPRFPRGQTWFLFWRTTCWLP